MLLGEFHAVLSAMYFHPVKHNFYNILSSGFNSTDNSLILSMV